MAQVRAVSLAGRIMHVAANGSTVSRTCCDDQVVRVPFAIKHGHPGSRLHKTIEGRCALTHTGFCWSNYSTSQSQQSKHYDMPCQGVLQNPDHARLQCAYKTSYTHSVTYQKRTMNKHTCKTVTQPPRHRQQRSRDIDQHCIVHRAIGCRANMPM